MTTAIVMQSAKAMTSPPAGAPRILLPEGPDLVIGLDLIGCPYTVAGGLVTAITARGSGSADDRAFDKKRGSNWTFPEFAAEATPSDAPALLFSGFDQIANVAADDDFRDARSQPYTRIVVAKITAWGNNDRSRLIGGQLGHLTNIVPTTTAGRFEVSAGSTATVDLPGEDDDWFAIGVVANGASSLIYINGMDEPVEVSIGSNTWRGERIGGSASSSPGSAQAMHGYVAGNYLYGIAVDAPTLMANVAYRASQFGIS